MCNFKYTKHFAGLQIVLGILCIVVGAFDRKYMYTRGPRDYSAFQSQGVIAIWTGAWFLITGILGLFASRYDPTAGRPKRSVVYTYMAFSITSAALAGIALLCFGLGVALLMPCSENGILKYRYVDYYPTREYQREEEYKIPLVKECNMAVRLGAVIIVLAGLEFVIAIFAAVLCCPLVCKSTTSRTNLGQVVYLQTQGGPVAAYVMTQGPNGMPVAVPAMTGGPVYQPPNQAVGGQVYTQNHDAAIEMPTKQGDATLDDQQPTKYSTDEPPPLYTRF